MRTAIDVLLVVFGAVLLVGGTIALVFGLALCVVSDNDPDGAE